MHTRIPRPVRRGAVGVVALTALLALAGCSSDGDAEAKAKPTQSTSGKKATATTDSQASTPSEGPSAPASKGPVLPDAKLSPATGSFTANEKKYLSGRVPVDMDPAAVLQTGQETCQRIERTAAHDKNAAIGAIISGDLPEADAAIKQLCPKQQPLLDAAATGFADGTRKNPEPGTYQALTTAAGCTWQAMGEEGKVLAAGPGTGAGKKVTAEIPAGTRTFVSTGCYAWLPA
ncbi:hypothetical protein [Streptomyces marianii]|uniref:DUF732 domain-containing protein n=1 Tax=Streptomyces marianii TaxID=1817406 RepID=A0A5R9EB93_9ACTN|nr:hypothetical protein [Streptomyces marianii]TLQ47196.1 hypothetical protein FEF34_33315 [Streptomyces marianii]